MIDYLRELATIETPIGSQVKYDIHRNVTRFLQNNQCYPANYGYIPNTLCEDGDALDIFVFGTRLEPGSTIPVYVRGGLYVKDDRGFDPKLIASPVGYEETIGVYNHYKSLESFLPKYKYSHEKVEIGDVFGFEVAKLLINETKEAYAKSNNR